jgi:hypothetical protein
VSGHQTEVEARSAGRCWRQGAAPVASEAMARCGGPILWHRGVWGSPHKAGGRGGFGGGSSAPAADRQRLQHGKERGRSGLGEAELNMGRCISSVTLHQREIGAVLGASAVKKKEWRTTGLRVL